MNLYTIVSFCRNDSSSDKVSSLAAVATGVGNPMVTKLSMTMMEIMKITKKTTMTMTEITKKKKMNPPVTKLIIILVVQVCCPQSQSTM